MEEENSIQLTHLQRLLLQLSQYDVNTDYLKGSRMSLQMHFPEFQPCQQDEHQKDIISVHILTTETAASASVAEIRKSYTRTHNIRPTNANSHEWLVRATKG